MEHSHRRRYQAIVILEILFDFRLGLFLSVARVPFDVAGDKQDEDERRQDPKRPVQVRTLRILRLKFSVKGDQASTDPAADGFRADLEVGHKRRQCECRAPSLHGAWLSQLILGLLSLFTLFARPVAPALALTLVILCICIMVVIFKHHFDSIHAQ